METIIARLLELMETSIEGWKLADWDGLPGQENKLPVQVTDESPVGPVQLPAPELPGRLPGS